jgi:hypothetical protein
MKMNESIDTSIFSGSDRGVKEVSVSESKGAKYCLATCTTKLKKVRYFE